MRTLTSLPPKWTVATCTRCGLTAGAPIVIAVANAARCSNTAACARRRRRTENAAKAAAIAKVRDRKNAEASA